MVAGTAISGTAAAQATSWMYAGGGSSIAKSTVAEPDGNTSSAVDIRSLLHVDVGLGVAANRNFVWGGLARMQLHGPDLLDLGLLARGTTGGFARGDYGAGADIGVVRRWWDQSSTALTANLLFGAPWGLTVVAGATLGRHDERTFQLSIGLDFARLTVHRQSGLNWFPNPLPSPAATP